MSVDSTMEKKYAAIHQPNFLPWLGYFHKMSMVDVFVLLDDVQVPQGKSFANRALIKTHTGELWITVPTLNRSDKGGFQHSKILNSNWKTKSLKTIRLAYHKAPYFGKFFDSFSEIYLRPFEKLVDLNYHLLVFLKECYGLKADIIFSSRLGVDPSVAGAEKILSILERVSATSYISGKGGGSRRYINDQDFKDRNINLIWQEFEPPVYPQLHGPFIPNLSAIDYLFNCGGKNPDNNIFPEV